MTNYLSRVKTFFVLLIATLGLLGMQQAVATDFALLEQTSRAELKSLYDGSPGLKALGGKAKAVLVFPKVTKAGFIIGGQGGDGILLINDTVAGYYNTAAVSLGLQAGVQSFGYVLFFMSDKVLTEFQNSKNFQVGVGPTIVFVDAGAAKDMSTLTAKSDVYGTIFDQKGLMAGISLEGTKITKLKS